MRRDEGTAITGGAGQRLGDSTGVVATRVSIEEPLTGDKREPLSTGSMCNTFHIRVWEDTCKVTVTFWAPGGTQWKRQSEHLWTVTGSSTSAVCRVRVTSTQGTRCPRADRL